MSEQSIQWLGEGALLNGYREVVVVLEQNLWSVAANVKRCTVHKTAKKIYIRVLVRIMLLKRQRDSSARLQKARSLRRYWMARRLSKRTPASVGWRYMPTLMGFRRSWTERCSASIKLIVNAIGYTFLKRI